MDIGKGTIIILAMCVVVLGIGFIRKRMEVVLNFFLHAVLGIFAIYILNSVIGTKNPLITVGINPITVVTAGVLGIPGVALLYSMVLTKII